MNQHTPRPTVVIAEDYVLLQEMIRAVLEQDCDVVAVVEDGHAALQAVAAHEPEIVTLDVSLPLMRGFAVAEQLQHRFPHVNVIFITAYDDAAYKQRAEELGAKAYLLKSSISVELRAAVRAIVAGRPYRSARIPL